MKSVMMLIHIFVFCIIFLSGCGENKAGQEHYALKIETEILSNEQITDKKWQLLATQFYCEQAVQLYADVKEGNTFDMYCYYSDGSTELLCNDIDSEWIRSSWYVDINGGVLAWKENTIVKWGKDGQLIFHYLLDWTIWDVCQLERGDLYLLIDNDEQNKMKIVELDTESGKYNESRCIYVDFQPIQYISGNDKGILLLNKDGIEQYNVKDGSRNEVVLFRRTTYQIDQIENGVSYPSDFRLTEEGKIEILRSRVLEKLSMVDVTEEKTVLVLRTYNVSGIIKKAVDNFNSENEEYYVVIEASEEDEESEDFKQLTNVQLATGNGADIILGSAINDVFALLEKGLLEDLRPYMELSGIEEEDYFPIAFNSWKEAEKIYGVNMYVQPKETWVLKELIKSKEGATIYSFVDALLNYEKEAILWMTWDAQEVLEYLFSGSEDLWGMVDWNNKSCAFENEFFAKMLEVSLRYGDNTKTHTSEVSTLIGPRKNIGLYSYETDQELLEEDKEVIPIIENRVQLYLDERN